MKKLYGSFIVLALIFVFTYQNSEYAQSLTPSTHRSNESVLSNNKFDGKVQVVSDNKVQILSPAKVSGTVYFSEDFDGIPGSTAGGPGTYVFPSGWVLANVDGLTPASAVAYVNAAWIRREDFANNVADSAAFSTSWYSPAGQSDDWMISPPITIGANTVLTWNAIAYDASYPDGYEVRISTTTQNVNGCLANPALFSIPAENSSWTERSVNLGAAGYSNQTVYIAWRNNSIDKFLLLIDDIVVQENLNYDAQITSVLQPSEYTRIPAWQNYPLNLGASVKNNGQSDLTNVKVTANVYQNSALVYTEMSNPVATLASGSTILINLDSYAIADTGVVEIKYIVSSDETDPDSTNNIGMSNQIYITENEFARDDNNLTGSLGIGAGNGGEMGQDYLLNVAGYIRNVKFYFDRCYPDQPVHGTIRNFYNGKPADIIAVTDTFYAPDTDGRWITLNIEGGESAISADTIVVNINEEDSTLALGLTNNIFTPKTNWVNWPTNPFGDWANSEDYGFTKPFMIRPLIYKNQLATDVNPSVLNVNEFGLSQNYPNPFNPSTSISFKLAHSSNVTLKIYDVLGNEVAALINDYRLSGSYKVDFNASSLTSGVYFYELKAGDFRSVKKMILMK
jgi:hypothetical protein